jgi:hypothetical protein
MVSCWIIRLAGWISSVRLASLIFLLVVSLTGAGPAARAQLPQVQVPKVPVPGVPALPEVTRAVAGNLRDLAGARALRAERLLREHRAELDRDPRGDLVVRAEVIAIDITQAALDKALAAKFSVLRTEELAGLGVKLTILQTPEGMSASRGLKRLRKLDPEGSYDFNHVYLDSGEVDPGQASLGSVDPRPNAGDSTNGRVGLIDGGVDGAHQTFSRLQVQRHGCDGTIVPSAHGTAVASILVARGNIAEVFAADVYCGQPTGGAVDAVAAAFGWLAR